MVTVCFIHVDSTVMLTSNITLVSDAILCPGGVKFTCIAELEGLATLRWFKSNNGQEQQPLATYIHDQYVSLPFTILASPKIVTFNSTLEANLSWFLGMNVSSIGCGSYGDFGTHHSSYLIRSNYEVAIID